MQDNFLNFLKVADNVRMPGGRPTKTMPSPLGARIAEARSATSLSQTDLANKIGVPQYTIAYWERKSAALKADQLALLADALDVTTDFLLGRQAINERPTGKAASLFAELSKLPRNQQQRILSMLEDMILAQKTKKAS